MPKYYQCKRSPSHFLSCPDGRVLRRGYQCVFPFGGGSKQCGMGLLPPVSALPFGTDSKRILVLEDRYTTAETSVLPPSTQPVPLPSSPSSVPSSSGGGLSFGGGPTPTFSFGGSPSSPPSVLPSIQYHYQCGNSAQRHRWVTTMRLDRPEEVQCPAKVLFSSCDKPLTYLPSAIFGQSYASLDVSAVRRSSTVSTHVFTSFMPSSSGFGFSSPVPVRPEARSQSDLTKILMESRQVSFLCRDGTFREAPQPRSSSRALNEYVEEPGLCSLGPLTLQRIGLPAIVVGCNEVMELRESGTFLTNPFTPGAVTYPDFVVAQGSYQYAVELKTPRTSTLAAYLGSGFYDARRDSSFASRSVKDEIEARARALPEGYHQMMAFDLFNLTEGFGDTVRAVQAEITGGLRRDFWDRIKGFLFIEKDGTVRTFSKDELLAHGRSQTTLGFSLVTGIRIEPMLDEVTTTTASTSASSSQASDDERALEIIEKVNRGALLLPGERRFLRDKLQAMRIFGCDDYIPQALRSMSALERLVLERKL